MFPKTMLIDEQSNLKENPQSIFINHRLQNNSTYIVHINPESSCFSSGALNRKFPPQSFISSHLINFLSNINTTHSYAISTLQLMRFAVTHLHSNARSLQDDAPPQFLYHHPSSTDTTYLTA